MKLPRTLNEWLWALVAASLLFCVVVIAVHLPGWCHGVDNSQARLQTTVGNLQAASTDLSTAVAYAKRDVAQFNVQPLNAALRNAQTVTENVARTTGDVAAFTKDANDNRDVVEEALALLWQHVDNTVGHIDKATLDEQGQQKQVAEKTIATLAATAKTMHDVDDLTPTVSHTLTNVQDITTDGAAITDHYKKILTAPKRWWERVVDPIETFGAKVLGAFL